MKTQKFSDYDGRKVLVTGGAGFLGSDLVYQLVSLGADVSVYDNLYSGLLEYIPSTKVNFIQGDVRNFERLRKAVGKNEVVFHLAAQPFIPFCYRDPRVFIDVNVMGNLNLMLAAAKQSTPLVVHVSSSEVYGHTSKEKMAETFPLNPYSSYATTKVAAERLSYTLSKEHGIPLIIARPFNFYGPRDTHPRIIPTIISQLSKSKVLKLGTTSTARDLTYVSDIARGLVELTLCKKAVGETINLGSETAYTVSELVDLISKIMKKDNVEVIHDNSLVRPLDPQFMISDSSKIRKMIGWEPEVNLAVGIERTLEWYKSAGLQWAWEGREQSTVELNIRERI